MITDRILQIIDYKGINKRKFYIETGLSNGFLDKVKDIGASKIEDILATYPDINPEWLLTGKGYMTAPKAYSEDESMLHWIEDPGIIYTKRVKKPVPLYDVQTPEGIITLFGKSDQEPIDYISVPNLQNCDGAIYVSGNSMYPILKSGDIILFKKMSNTIDNIFWGEMYLVSFSTDDLEEFLMIKWIKKSEKGEDWVKLVSENMQHEPKDIEFKHIKGLALIKTSIRTISTY